MKRMYGSTRELNDPQLARLEQIIPGIGNELRVIRAIKDIEYAGQNKVGTYANALLGAGSVMTGNIPGIVAAVVMSPPVLVPLLQWYGRIKGNAAQMDGILNKIRAGARLTDEEKASVGDAMKEYDVRVGTMPYRKPEQPKPVESQDAKATPAE